MVAIKGQRRNRKLTYGKGINDAEYNTQQMHRDDSGVLVLDWVCPYYAVWRDMLKRCFSAKYKNKNPAYADVICCDEWLTFSNFKAWMEQQDWEGRQLDKDLLVAGNNIYSPETCVFVPSLINNFVCKKRTKPKDTGTPFVVSKLKSGNYQALLSNNLMKGTYSYLGIFKTLEEAHRAWQKEKIIITEELLNIFCEDTKICRGLTRILHKIQRDIGSGNITTSF